MEPNKVKWVIKFVYIWNLTPLPQLSSQVGTGEYLRYPFLKNKKKVVSKIVFS